MNAERLMLLGGVSAFLLTIYWVRGRDLREKYAILWIVVAFVLLLCGLFPRGIMILADASQLSYPSAVLFFALAAIYLFCFTVSVSLTRQYRRNIRLTQNIALLDQRIRQLESLGRIDKRTAEDLEAMSAATKVRQKPSAAA